MIEDGEPERRAPMVKKTLEQFLEEFEVRLRDHPGQAATSATAALEGRAEGVWRTPVEGVERFNRRLPRRPASRPVPAAAPAPQVEPVAVPDPVSEEPPTPAAVAIPDPVAALPVAADEVIVAAAAPGTGVEEATPTAVPAASTKRRHRHRRHHRSR